MKPSTSPYLVIALCVSLLTLALAEDKSGENNPKPTAVESGSGNITATVASIDYKTRIVKMKSQDGSLITMEAGPEITRLDEVKVGDRVTIDYLVSVAVAVESVTGAKGPIEGAKSVVIRNQTKEPSGIRVDTEVATATVEAIDAVKRTATLKTSDGSIPIQIAPDVRHLENVKVGDQVQVRLTRTVAMKVSRP